MHQGDQCNLCLGAICNQGSVVYQTPTMILSHQVVQQAELHGWQHIIGFAMTLRITSRHRVSQCTTFIMTMGDTDVALQAVHAAACVSTLVTASPGLAAHFLRPPAARTMCTAAPATCLSATSQPGAASTRLVQALTTALSGSPRLLPRG